VITDRPGARAERWLKQLSWAYDERQIAAPPRPGQHWQLTDPTSTRKTAMNRIQRCLAALAGLGATLIILAAAAPAAFASVPASGPTPTSPRPLPPRWYQHHPHLPPGHTYTSRFTSRPFRSPSHRHQRGMPGWQITLIAAGRLLQRPRWPCWLTGHGEPGGARQQPDE
jgi:hypothetical protein